jgi:hypothetical protein
VILEWLQASCPAMSLYRSITMVDGGGYGEGGSGEKLGAVAIFLAGAFVLIGTGISLVSIWSHLKNYRKPVCSCSQNYAHQSFHTHSSKYPTESAETGYPHSMDVSLHQLD